MCLKTYGAAPGGGWSPMSSNEGTARLGTEPVRPGGLGPIALRPATGEQREAFALVRPPPADRAAGAALRPSVRGKFLFVGDEKLYVRGVTYGTFRPRADGSEVPEPDVAERDFALMAANGINAVRTYSVPPRWLLDAAQRHHLRVMVGLPVERYIGFLADKKKGAPHIEALVRAGVRACAGHPAVLCYA